MIKELAEKYNIDIQVIPKLMTAVMVVQLTKDGKRVTYPFPLVEYQDKPEQIARIIEEIIINEFMIVEV